MSAQVKTLILRTAGTNCDEETAFAFQQAGARARKRHVNVLRQDPDILLNYDILAIPGGFSYGDDLGAGTVLANELITLLRDALNRFVESGRLVIGICNGFQVLVKTGLLPAMDRWRQEVTLTMNDSHKFEDRWTNLTAPRSKCVLVEDDEQFYLPVAHAEGKFVPADEDTLRRLRNNGQIVLCYADESGNTDVGYPANPNGSVGDVAAICDPTGRILGMMPHPERHVLPYHHPRWTREGLEEVGDGCVLFRRAVEFIQSHPVRDACP
ncbi:MAG: phosphoribosylformylglycinamidine synthase I [Planctomycetota bacterium]